MYMYLSDMSAIIAVVGTPFETGTPVVVINFVAHKMPLTHMESLICTLHLPEPNELSEQSPVQAHSARQWMSRAWPQLGLGPSPGISARYDSVRAEGSAHFAKPDQESQYKCWLGYVMRSSTSIQTR